MSTHPSFETAVSFFIKQFKQIYGKEVIILKYLVWLYKVLHFSCIQILRERCCRLVRAVR